MEPHKTRKQVLLAYRSFHESPPSFFTFFRHLVPLNLVLLLAAAFPVATISFLVDDPDQKWLEAFMTGYVLSMLFITGVFAYSQSKTWPTIEEITDWEAVEEKCSAFD